jgi:alpha-beta hydrolase superfamily lysophospholipase
MRMEYFEILYKCLGVNIVAVAYRGYSNSEGSPSEAGLVMDAEAAVTFCREESRINDEMVFLLGRSLGGAVCVHVAAKMSLSQDFYFSGVIVESTFTTASDMVDVVFP